MASVMSFWLFSSHSTSLCFLIVSGVPAPEFVDVPAQAIRGDVPAINVIPITWVMKALSKYKQENEYQGRLHVKESRQGIRNDLIFIPLYVCFEWVVGSLTSSRLSPRATWAEKRFTSFRSYMNMD